MGCKQQAYVYETNLITTEPVPFAFKFKFASSYRYDSRLVMSHQLCSGLTKRQATTELQKEKIAISYFPLQPHSVQFRQQPEQNKIDMTIPHVMSLSAGF